MVRNIVAEEMIGAERLAGYRSIWHALRLGHQVHAPRSLVARLVKELDPEGVEERRSRRLYAVASCLYAVASCLYAVAACKFKQSVLRAQHNTAHARK